MKKKPGFAERHKSSGYRHSPKAGSPEKSMKGVVSIEDDGVLDMLKQYHPLFYFIVNRQITKLADAIFNLGVKSRAKDRDEAMSVLNESFPSELTVGGEVIVIRELSDKTPVQVAGEFCPEAVDILVKGGAGADSHVANLLRRREAEFAGAGRG